MRPKALCENSKNRTSAAKQAPKKKPHGCHPESPSGLRDLHLHCYRHLHWPFLPSEISNLKFEISVAFAVGFAFAFVGALACCARPFNAREITR
jgi:hypothetical protein